jgi:serine/threonine-protein kinase RsbT
MAAALGFSSSDRTVIATAICELARNIIEYATSGDVLMARVERNGRAGMMVVARDQGPGIADLARALSAGYSSGQGLGMGLPGVRRLMDEFEVSSQPGTGTTVTVRKWLP